MRILFVSAVGVGGAPRSTGELADVLARRGHDVRVVLGKAPLNSGLYGLVVRGAVKLRTVAHSSAGRLAARPFGRSVEGHRVSAAGVTVLHVMHPENYLPRGVREFRPDVVVANSFPREPMRWIAADLRRVGVPLALYMREQHAVTHLSQSGLRPDVVLANSRHLVNAALELGVACSFAPSVVDLSASAVESLRTKVLLINPVAENRPSILRTLADNRPDIHCTLQESWPLDLETRRDLAAWCETRPNLEFRPRSENPSEVYRDARLLLATYPTGRPRVVLEAQYNGIPVVALDQPALSEAVGPGGVLVSGDLSDDEWAQRIAGVWDDQCYEELERVARGHGNRPEVQPEVIAQQVESALRAVVA